MIALKIAAVLLVCVSCSGMLDGAPYGLSHVTNLASRNFGYGDYWYSGAFWMEPARLDLAVKELILLHKTLPRPFDYQLVAQHMIPQMQTIFNEPNSFWIVKWENLDENVHFQEGYFMKIRLSNFRQEDPFADSLDVIIYRPKYV